MKIQIGLFICPTKRPPEATAAKNHYTPPNARYIAGTPVAKSDYAACSGDPAVTDVTFGPPNPTVAASPLWSWPPCDAPNQHCNGVSYQRSMVKLKDITDGTTLTYMVGEKFQLPASYAGSFASGSPTYDFGDNESIYSGYNRDQHRSSRYLPAQDRDGVASGHWWFGSAHSDGFGMAMCDSSVRRISFSIDPLVHRRLGIRNDGEVVDEGSF
jgi:hypothetical protein